MHKNMIIYTIKNVNALSIVCNRKYALRKLLFNFKSDPRAFHYAADAVFVCPYVPKWLISSHDAQKAKCKKEQDGECKLNLQFADWRN